MMWFLSAGGGISADFCTEERLTAQLLLAVVVLFLTIPEYTSG